ncbi:MAG: Clo7bot family Cys-rich peptide [Paraclostridium bifermentans]|nr:MULTISPECIES: Clo7bot family Cys-rich peptide [Paraclostridium]MBS5953798.1 Clo7bot family Cys-rich peptide [Paraclostridium bifermentans]
MKFIRKPANKFEKGYCFACVGMCNSNSGCVVKDCQNYGVCFEY